ncbi:Uncharacterized conserved protein [Filimonas lacunae]|uniref:Uncharacterized conserved protein n=1 Tax=Filimonas lacunae TaxID=477680 RepID=A0A173MAD3_9BACT|nr:DUF1214 domain-containing protein [Filimonas lacunae]BAV04496.1 exported protein [Filimonas lacunae]SIT31581.1 Uncharacterized conserved protein [Filimonas lacunae]
MKKATFGFLMVLAAIILHSCNSTTPASIAAMSRKPVEEYSTLTDDEIIAIVKQAYTTMYPLVMMELNKRVCTNVATPDDNGYAPVNQMGHRCEYPDASSGKENADLDMFYSSAFLDISHSPMVLTVPDEMGRYYMFTMVDAWGRVFATASQSGAGSYAITAPGWQGELPKGIKQIKAPSDMVWIAGRTQVNDETDGEIVKLLMRRYALIPLSKWGQPYQAPVCAVDNEVNMQPATVQAANMSVMSFLNLGNRLMQRYAHSGIDTNVLARMSMVNIGAGLHFDTAVYSTAVNKALVKLPEMMKQEVLIACSNRQQHPNKWEDGEILPVWVNCQCANVQGDAFALTVKEDVTGSRLDGNSRYLLHFTRSQVPLAKAFWSLTMYKPASRLVQNAIGRYAIGNRDRLLYNADGSLDIYIQKEHPGNNKASNWLPAPAGAFSLTMRMYGIQQDKKEISRTIPPLQKV